MQAKKGLTRCQPTTNYVKNVVTDTDFSQDSISLVSKNRVHGAQNTTSTHVINSGLFHDICVYNDVFNRFYVDKYAVSVGYQHNICSCASDMSDACVFSIGNTGFLHTNTKLDSIQCVGATGYTQGYISPTYCVNVSVGRALSIDGFLASYCRHNLDYALYV